MMTSFRSLLPKDAKEVDGRFFLNFKGKSDCIYSGIYLGELVGEKFIPSLFLLETNQDKFGKITLNKKNEWFFSCNKIVTDCVFDDFKGEYVIAKNAYNEIIGVAKRYSNKFIPIWDIGSFLRRESNQKI